VFSTFGLVFAIVLAALGTWSIADELRGSEALAEVLDVNEYLLDGPVHYRSWRGV
jgi:hypothetical protein